MPKSERLIDVATPAPPVAQRQPAGDTDQALAVENELRRMKANDRIMRRVEHVLAAKEFVAHLPTGIDRRSIDDKIDATRVLLRIEHNRAVRPAEMPALPR